MRNYKLFVGIDISKKTLSACLITYPEMTEENYLTVENTVDGIAEILQAVASHEPDLNQTLFCIENTGYYGMRLLYELSILKANYWVVSGLEIKRSKGMVRGKTDKRDARTIAIYGYTHLYMARCSVLPEKDILKLQLLHTEREKVVKSIKRFKMSLEWKGFLPDDVFA